MPVMFYLFLILGLMIWLQWYLAKLFQTLARSRGFDDSKYFWICFWLGIVGYLLVLALPDRSDCSPALPDPPSAP